MKFTQTPTPSITATPSMTPSVSPSYTPTGTVCPGLTPTATSTPIPSLTPSLTPTITPSTSPCINCYEYSFTASTSGILSWLDCDGILTDTFVNSGETYNITCLGARQGSVIGTGTITQGILCSSTCLTPTPTPTPTHSPTTITYDLYDADRYICDYPGCTLDATGIVVALPSGTSPNYGKFYPSYIPDGFAYLLNSTTIGGPGWILSTLNYTSCTDACSLPPE